MKKIILSIALLVGFVTFTNAQTSATGAEPVSKPKPLIATTQPDANPKTTATETKPVSTSSTSTTSKKSTKKSCCKQKSDDCCKKKTEAIKED